MFGYIRPHKPEMLMREYEAYKAVYCELCRVLGKQFGIASRFTLSYDCTFYALVALAATGCELTVKQGRCVVNPLKPCKFILAQNDAYIQAAALSILLTYYKLQDNIEDERFLKRSAARLGGFFMRRKMRKAKNLYPQLADAVEEAMEAQKQSESAAQPSIDACAEPTAALLAEVFSNILPADDVMRPALREFGYFLGRWVYLMDAADDLKNDLENHNFNPFARALHLESSIAGKESQALFTGETRKEAEEFCNSVLNATISMMIPAINLVELKHFQPIIENVIEKGLPQMQREIIFLHVREKKHDRSV